MINLKIALENAVVDDADYELEFPFSEIETAQLGVAEGFEFQISRVVSAMESERPFSRRRRIVAAEGISLEEHGAGFWVLLAAAVATAMGVIGSMLGWFSGSGSSGGGSGGGGGGYVASVEKKVQKAQAQAKVANGIDIAGAIKEARTSSEAKARLIEELKKLSIWQISLVDEHSDAYKFLHKYEAAADIVANMQGTMVGASDVIFEQWAAINDGNASKEVMEKLQLALTILGGEETDTGGSDSLKGFRAKMPDGTEVMSYLHEFGVLKIATEKEGTMQPISDSQAPTWISALFKTTAEDFDEDLIAVKEFLADTEKAYREFKTKADQFFKDVPEESSETAIWNQDKTTMAKKMLGANGDDNNWSGVGTPASKRAPTRKAIQNVLEFFAIQLRAQRTLVTSVHDLADLSNHMLKFVHELMGLKIAECKAKGEDVPDEVQEAHDKLSAKALKQAA